MEADKCMKTCKSCKKAKPESEFYRSRRTSDRLQGVCKVCWRARDAEWKRVHHAQCLEHYRKYRRAHLADMRAKDRIYYRMRRLGIIEAKWREQFRREADALVAKLKKAGIALPIP